MVVVVEVTVVVVVVVCGLHIWEAHQGELQAEQGEAIYKEAKQSERNPELTENLQRGKQGTERSLRSFTEDFWQGRVGGSDI